MTRSPQRWERAHLPPSDRADERISVSGRPDGLRADSSIGAQMSSLAGAVAMAVSMMLSDYERSTRREPAQDTPP